MSSTHCQSFWSSPSAIFTHTLLSENEQNLSLVTMKSSSWASLCCTAGYCSGIQSEGLYYSTLRCIILRVCDSHFIALYWNIFVISAQHWGNYTAVMNLFSNQSYQGNTVYPYMRIHLHNYTSVEFNQQCLIK